MKIVKRDGRTVDYNSDKIRIAINKANNEVGESDKITEKEIEKIIQFIEFLDKKRMLVEDIQDIIEEKLMEQKKYTLAKKYIIYRYTRSIIRKSNTTDASILSLLKNNDVDTKNYLVVNRQRDVMAGEASKDLAYRLLLPQNVVEADKENCIKFCNVEYFTEPVIESLKIDLHEILSQGTVINGVRIEAPKGFQSVCNVLIEIIAALASSQTGNIYINFSDLFKYYYLTYDKKYKVYKALLNMSEEEISAFTRTQSFLEVSSGIQTLFYQINTITLASGLVPKVCLLVNPRDAKNEIEEQIIHELIRQKSLGLNNSLGNVCMTKYPMIIYANPNDDKYDYLLKNLLEIKSDMVIMNDKSFKKFDGALKKFNQGTIILNLARIALNVKNNPDLSFNSEVEKYLEYCYEGMLCRNHNLQGIYSDKSPIHWQYGSIAKMKSGEKIDSLLKKDHSFMQLVVVGFEAALSVLESENKLEIKQLIENRVDIWNQTSSFEVCLSNYYDENVINAILKNDEELIKKTSIQSYFDSPEFIKNDYFSGAFIYIVTSLESKDFNDELLDRGIVYINSESK